MGAAVDKGSTSVIDTLARLLLFTRYDSSTVSPPSVQRRRLDLQIQLESGQWVRDLPIHNALKHTPGENLNGQMMHDFVAPSMMAGGGAKVVREALAATQMRG